MNVLYIYVTCEMLYIKYTALWMIVSSLIHTTLDEVYTRANPSTDNMQDSSIRSHVITICPYNVIVWSIVRIFWKRIKIRNDFQFITLYGKMPHGHQSTPKMMIYVALHNFMPHIVKQNLCLKDITDWQATQTVVNQISIVNSTRKPHAVVGRI